MNYVIIPMKDRKDLTQGLLRQLVDQGGYEEILIFDNGSNGATKKWLRKQTDIARVFDASGMNIHEMWNAGLDYIDGRGHAAILNNDLNIGPNFLRGLASALDADDSLAVVCPNYDKRPGTGVQYVHNICANKYDGTGGLAGFAFMLRRDVKYRFPEELRWWCGDNHMVTSLLLNQHKVGIALDTSVEHINNGGQTGKWETNTAVHPLLRVDVMWWEWWKAWVTTE